MINFDNLNENYEKYKPLLLQLFSEYYRGEYQAIIEERINSSYIDFSSTPREDYLYSILNKDKFSREELTAIDNREKEYTEVLDKFRMKNEELFFNYLVDKLSIKGAMKNKMEIITLCSDMDFDSSLIDSFNLQTIQRLESPKTPLRVKECILNEQNRFKSKIKDLGIIQINLDPDSIDDIILYRKRLQQSYMCDILTNSHYGQKMIDIFKKKFNCIADPSDISGCAFTKDPMNFVSTLSNGEVIYYIKIPIFQDLNKCFNTLDSDLIHELVHRIESTGNYVGIFDHSREINNCINELRTQKIAIEITEKLHKMGIYIYDDPTICRNEARCVYAFLFPIFDDFYDKYERLFSDCAIQNDLKRLEVYFYPFWEKYSKYMDHLLADTLYYSRKIGEPFIPTMSEEMTDLLDSMNSAYTKRMRKNI